MKNIVKLCVKIFRYLMGCFDPFFARVSGKFLRNIRISNDAVKGRALMIYITSPFTGTEFKNHTNIQESVVMADVLSAMGYNVDVMDFSNPFDYYPNDYDLIIGFGDVFENFFYTSNSATKIYYATGSPQSVHCMAETRRLKRFEERNGHKLVPRRVLDRTWPCSEVLSDAIISVTDGWACEQFKLNHDSVYSVNITALVSNNKFQLDVHKKKKNHFIWFGSSGSVHKGLDICLEVFAKRDDLVLHICGAIKNESDFYAYYEDILSQPNIKEYGLVDVNSQLMNHLMSTVTYAILPSCSEGCSTSILTCMAWGCIPVITKQCGISFAGSVLINSGTVEGVSFAINSCLAIEKSKSHEQMQAAVDYASSKHSLSAYEGSLKLAIEKITTKSV